MKRLTPLLCLLLAACSALPGLAPAATPDLKSLSANAPLLLLNVADLPSEAKYRLPEPSGTGEVDNPAVLDSWGTADGAAYIKDTGRLNGWWIQFNRTVESASGPAEVYDSLVVYQSAAGARLSVEKYSSHGMSAYNAVQGSQVGDASRAYVLKSPGQVDYVLYFSYRNVQHVVEIIGSDADTTPAFALALAQALIQKIKSAPADWFGS